MFDPLTRKEKKKIQENREKERSVSIYKMIISKEKIPNENVKVIFWEMRESKHKGSGSHLQLHKLQANYLYKLAQVDVLLIIQVYSRKPEILNLRHL